MAAVAWYGCGSVVQPAHRARNTAFELLDQCLGIAIGTVRISTWIYLKAVFAMPAVATFGYWFDLKSLSYLLEG